MKYILIILFALFTIHYALLPVAAFAACDPNKDLCNPLSSDDFTVLVGKVISFIKDLVLYALAPLMVVIGGFQIMTAGGNPEQVTKGRKTVMYALIGIVVVLLAEGLVSLIKDILGVTK
ncbi:MAG: pilin [Patescibacteria group bacterium]